MANDTSMLAPIPRLSLRLPEAAEAIGISERLLHDWEKQGIIPSVRIGGVVLFSVDQLREWLNSATGDKPAKVGSER